MSPSYDDWTVDPTRCRTAALALCVMHVLSVFVLVPSSWSGSYDIERLLSGEWLNRFFLVSYGLWLAPIAAVFLARKNCAALGIYAIPIFAIFFGRIYYVWLFHTTGYFNSKGDGASWGMTFVGMAAVVIVAVWVLVRIFSLIFPMRERSSPPHRAHPRRHVNLALRRRARRTLLSARPRTLLEQPRHRRRDEARAQRFNAPQCQS